MQLLGQQRSLLALDVDEAVYLSQRVYVMQTRPGRIVEEVALPFGIGLGPAVERMPMFLDVRDEIHALLLSAPGSPPAERCPTGLAPQPPPRGWLLSPWGSRMWCPDLSPS